MSVRAVIVSLALVVLSVSLSACGLVFGGSRQVVRINSTPTNATIRTAPATADAVTPSFLRLQRNRSYAVTIAAPGYASATIELERKMRVGIVVLDIVCGLVPVIVDAATGAWYKLEPNETTVTLTKAAADADGPETVVVHVAVDQRSGDPETVVRFSATHPVRANMMTRP